MSRLPLTRRLLLKILILFERRQRIRHLDDDLPLAMRAQALLAGVLVFDFEFMPVRADDLDSPMISADLPSSRSSEGNRLNRAIGIWIRAADRNPPMPSGVLACLSLCIRQSGSESYRKTLENQEKRCVSIVDDRR